MPCRWIIRPFCHYIFFFITLLVNSVTAYHSLTLHLFDLYRDRTEQNKYHIVLDNIITWSNIFNFSLPTVYLVLFYLSWYNQWLFMDSKFYAGVMWILIKSHFLNSLLFDIWWCLKPLSTIFHLKSWRSALLMEETGEPGRKPQICRKSLT